MHLEVLLDNCVLTQITVLAIILFVFDYNLSI